MNNEPRDEGRYSEDGDTGEPILALRALAVEPRAGFLSGIRNRIHRSVLAGDLADLSWKSWAEALLEYLAMIFGIVGPSQRERENGEG